MAITIVVTAISRSATMEAMAIIGMPGIQLPTAITLPATGLTADILSIGAAIRSRLSLVGMAMAAMAVTTTDMAGTTMDTGIAGTDMREAMTKDMATAATMVMAATMVTTATTMTDGLAVTSK